MLNESAGASDIEILVSTVRAQHSVVGTMNLDISEDRFGVRPLCRCTWLFVPVFTYHNFTALLFASERQYGLSNYFQLGKNMKLPTHNFYRTIRDNETGTMISFHIPEESQYVRIQIISTEKGIRQRSYFELKQSVLERGNLSEMWTSVSYHIHFCEQLSCNQCILDCCCEKTPSIRPSHHMDLGFTAKMLAPMAGSFYGTATLFLGNSRKRGQNVILGEISSSSPSGTRARLTSWSISNALTKYFSTVNLSRNYSMELVLNAQRTIAQCLPSISANAMSSKAPVCAPFSQFASNYQMFPVLDSVTSPESQATPNLDTPNNMIEIVTSFKNELPLVNEQPGVIVDTNQGSIHTISEQYSIDTFKNIDSVEFARGPVSADSIDPEKGERPSGTASPRSEKITAVGTDSAEEAKNMRRKMRNRESAARSNEKKRKKLANLKKDLSEGKEKIKRLRAQEWELREANSILERLVDQGLPRLTH